LKEENAKLRKEIEEQKDRNDELEDYYCDREDKLNEEIDELKEEMERIQENLDEMYEFSYFTKLKKAEVEIEKLKEEIDLPVNEKVILEAYRNEMKEIEKITGDEVEDIVDVKYYINKLKEEIEQLKKKEVVDEEDYDSENEDHSHKCSTCTKNAPSDQCQCDSCRPPFVPEEVEEEEGDSRCMTCEKRFCMYDAQKAEPEAYDKYFGSGDDDGDLCPQCLIKWQEEEE